MQRRREPGEPGADDGDVAVDVDDELRRRSEQTTRAPAVEAIDIPPVSEDCAPIPPDVRAGILSLANSARK